MRCTRIAVVATPAAAAVFCAAAAIALGSAAAPTTASNQAAARHDVRVLLAEVIVPSGASRLGGGPPGAGAIDNPSPQQGTPDLADAHAWWRVSASVASIIAFEQAHPPGGSYLDGHGGGSSTAGGGRSHSIWSYVTFAFPARPGVLESRAVIVKVAATASGRSAVRADAEDVWEVTRPASERVPAGVREIDVTRRAPGRAPAFSAKVTAPARVREIVALIDALPIVQPGVLACPMMPAGGQSVTFSFRAAGGAVLAQASQPVVAGPATACDAMSFVVAGRRQTPLLGGSGFLAAVAKLTAPGLTASS